MGKKPWVEFHMKTYAQGIKDMQTAKDVLINILLGNYSIMAYKVMREFQILSDAFEDHMPEGLKKLDFKDF